MAVESGPRWRFAPATVNTTTSLTKACSHPGLYDSSSLDKALGFFTIWAPVYQPLGPVDIGAMWPPQFKVLRCLDV